MIDEAVKKWLNYNDLSCQIWEKKYQRNNETFEQWLERVSGGDKEVAQLIKEKKFLFGGRILSNRGIDDSEEKTTYSNCYVCIPPKDNLESIYETCSKLAKTYAYGGGIGVDISNLAPRGAKVRNQAKTTSGAVSFMDTFSQVTETICQNGRRGALMISMDCSHPDIEEFIDIKTNLDKVNYANISVKVNDNFMKASKQNKNWKLTFTRPETNEVISKEVNAGYLFNKLCKNNWNYGEPGVLFWDRLTKWNLLSNNDEFSFSGVNPCGEQPLPAGGSCLLGSINLSEFVENGEFNYEEFQKTVTIAVRALNQVLDEGLKKHPLQEQRDSVRDWRQIGLGIMGLADMFIKMKVAYNSVEAVRISDSIGSTMIETAIYASSQLAKQYGAYPKYNGEVHETSFFEYNIEDETIIASVKKYGLRNSQLLTIAPTGTISTMLGISGGIEPIFANSYTRTTKSLHNSDVEYKVFTPIVKEYMDKNHLTNEEELPSYFVTAKDIPWKDRIEIQSCWQNYIDAAISSTINLPESATVEDVMSIYYQAWLKGLKGITIFRENCKRVGILNENSEQTSSKTVGLERHLTTGCGSLHICAFFNEAGNLKNTYLSKGSSGGCNNFMIGLSRMISLAARNNVPFNDIIDQLYSCGTCPSYAVRRATKGDTSKGSCCPVAIANALKEMRLEILGEECEKVNTPNINTPLCPECGEPLIFENGCNSCKSCGYSKCS